MGKSIILENDNYIDTKGVVHERTPLNEILNDKMQLVSLLNSRVTPSSLNNTVYGKLTDDYTNYDVLYVRITTSDGGGEGIWVTMIPNHMDQSNWEHYVLSTYRCSGQVFVQYGNEIGIRVREISGWSVSRVSIISVFGVKFK